jgi:hypothetical protein
VHSEAFVFNFPCRYQIWTNRVLFWQISSEVHFFPFKQFALIISSREAKLSHMPASDEVDLAICTVIMVLTCRLVINRVWMSQISNCYLSITHQRVGSVMSQ